MLKKQRRGLAVISRPRFPYRLCCAALVGALALVAPAQSVHTATFAVTKAADTNDGTCDADCSLREAIVAANASQGPDAINLPDLRILQAWVPRVRPFSYVLPTPGR